MQSKRSRTQQKLWGVAEQLFMERGLAAVTLQDIAAAMNMHHVSLYYYVPDGKEQLYVQVMERMFKTHFEGLTDSIQQSIAQSGSVAAGDHFRAQIHAVAVWFANHPPLDLGRIVRSDLPLLAPADAEHIINTSLEYLRLPIANVLRDAAKDGLVIVTDPDLAAMAFIALIQSVHNIPPHFIESREHLVQIAIGTADSLLDGWFKR